ncbi:MAG: tRNA 2-thiouridine(34) synthase MnmA [Ruminococcaceae bacterium]|nr:tRNA 2-thiouridine(34) synthase MnmA [Oscillospiraceae bacterium]
MDRKLNVTVAMSGGIDSAVAALLAIEQGYNVSGATLRLCDKILKDGTNATESDIEDAKKTCQALKIQHKVYDMTDLFKLNVVKNFIDTYLEGGTPNPCIVCNKHLKFGALLNLELKCGADLVATGHYAKIERDTNGRWLLKRAKDEKKDQTYMLWSLTQHQLAHSLFPLGNLTKPEIRKIGFEHGFINAHKSDSQDICFVPDGDYAAFIEKELGYKYPEGDYIDENGNVLGRHKGMIHYTIGQRKGLGISMGRHIFVSNKDAKTNTVTLTDEDRLFTDKVIIKSINLIPFDKLEAPMCVQAKVRYSQSSSPAFAQQTGEDEITLTFDTPQRAPAKGQSAVMYDGEYVIGGGIIQ